VSGWTTGWTSVVVGWSTFFIPFLFVLEPALLADAGIGQILWQLARNLLGIFVGTVAVVGYSFAPISLPSRFVHGALALAILVPPNVFPGADVLDWIGLSGAVGVLAFSYLRSLGRPTAKPATAE
jgi:TRAP-type uncharacterized transport system fused permease subunit